MNYFFCRIARLVVFNFVWGNLVWINSAIALDFMPFAEHYTPNKTIKSVKMLRDYQLIRQQYSFDCAVASLATILTYQYGESYTVAGIANILTVNLKPKRLAELKETGFSLFEIEQASKILDYKTAGYNFDTVEELQAFNFPSIARIVLNNVSHFVVVKQIEAGRVFLADPASGNRSMTVHQFNKIWQRRYAFFVLPKDKKLGDKTLVNELANKTSIAEHHLYKNQIPPNVWREHDFDKFTVTTRPFSLSK